MYYIMLVLNAAVAFIYYVLAFDLL